MCPITSLIDLFEDPCKSMWNSPVEVDLFSSAIFKVHFSANFGLFSLDYLCLCVLFLVLLLDYYGQYSKEV